MLVILGVACTLKRNLLAGFTVVQTECLVLRCSQYLVSSIVERDSGNLPRLWLLLIRTWRHRRRYFDGVLEYSSWLQLCLCHQPNSQYHVQKQCTVFSRTIVIVDKASILCVAPPPLLLLPDAVGGTPAILSVVRV